MFLIFAGDLRSVAFQEVKSIVWDNLVTENHNHTRSRVGPLLLVMKISLEIFLALTR